VCFCGGNKVGDLCWMLRITEFLAVKSACVCRGVLRFLRMRIQDSRTDFQPICPILVDGTSTRGWCKIKTSMGITTMESYVQHRNGKTIGAVGTRLCCIYNVDYKYYTK
jgi:hypothetical protein